jgi:hypothetical protein
MDEKDAYKELSSIRELMERSSKFISLSGLSGVLAGVYALIGARFAYRYIDATTDSGELPINDPAGLWPLIVIALAVLFLSIATSYWLSVRKAKSRNENIWNPVSKRLLAAIAIPMLTGGLFISIVFLKMEYTFIAPACLIFYGLALVAGSQFTFHEVRWLGICEISLGLLAMILSEYGLLIWAIGFGLLHIIYGTIMHLKYER